MRNPVTRKNQVTKDIIWLKQMMFQKRLDKDTAKILSDVKETIGLAKPQDSEVEEEQLDPSKVAARLVAKLESEPEEHTKEDDNGDCDDIDADQSQSKEKEGTTTWTNTTPSGRSSRKPIRNRNEIGGILSDAAKEDLIELEKYPKEKEVVIVRAGLGRVSYHTSELYSMKFNTTIKSEDKKSG